MKVAVVGIGAIGPVHIEALKKNGMDIVALCDVEIEKCEKAIKDFNLTAKAYADYENMLSSCELDSVHVCTPHYLHAPMIISALNKNINVLCEKPLAINKEQLDDIEIAVKNSKAKLGVCFQNHYNPSILYVKEFVEGKKIRTASANLVWERNADYYNQAEWRGTWAMEGGGVMINQAIHGLDMLLWMCGMPKSVTAYTSNVSLKNVVEVEDTAFGLFKLENGGTFVVNATNSASFSFPVYYTFKADNDVIQVSDNNIIINGEFLTTKDNEVAVGKDVWGASHTRLIKHFYECVKSGEKFPIDFYEASKVIKLILAMYKSNGEEIEIK